MPEAQWVDLLDPDLEQVKAHAPMELEESAIELMLKPPQHDDEPRPTLRSHGEYIWGVFLVAVVVHEEDVVYYQEIDVVVTHDKMLTVRKTPPGREPFECDAIRDVHARKPHVKPGMVAYHLVDDVAEHYLDLIDDLDEEIDTLEDSIEELPAERTRGRISELRHDLLHVRRTLAPTRDAVRRVVDDVIEVTKGSEVFPHDVEVAFNSVYDKLLRAIDGLELSRDLLASVRDYHQSKIANDQNEVMKRLTVIASLLLFPTLIVGVYGQNFDRMPELHWHYGYAWSWGIIVVSTIAQLAFFRWKRWI